jgi:ABC-type polysaccharide/polyol phosphate export permease
MMPLNLKILTVAKRYLKLDLKYKFQLAMDALVIAGNFIGFGIIGLFLEARGNVMPEGYTFEKFMLTGTYMWTMMARTYDDCIRLLGEEASRGTIMLLIESNVTITQALMGRAIASTIKYTLITSAFGLPVLRYIGALNFSIEQTPMLLLGYVCSWMFTLGLSMIMVAMTLIFKKIGMVTTSVMEIVMMAIGFYFPVELLPKQLWPITGVIPFTIGMQIFRDIMILGYPRDSVNAVYSSIGMGIMKMITSTMVFSIIAAMILRYAIIKAEKWGTVEQY